MPVNSRLETSQEDEKSTSTRLWHSLSWLFLVQGMLPVQALASCRRLSTSFQLTTFQMFSRYLGRRLLYCL